MWILGVLAVFGLGFGGYMFVNQAPAQETVVGGGEVGAACLGLQSVDLNFNDQNYFKASTDPASHVTVYEKNGAEYKLVLADDASSGNAISPNSKYGGVIGTNGGTPKVGYFSEMVSFDAGCTAVDLQSPKLKPSGAPTITVVNDDGITKNSDANHESMGASSTYLPTLTIKAPAEACSARHGAFVVADYDATYFSKLSSSDLSDGNTIVLLTHNSPTLNHTGRAFAGTNDQFKVFEYSGELCNGAKIEPQIKVETTSTEPIEDINIDFYWLSKDIDVDADTYKPLAPAIYDEDNNQIWDVNTNATYSGA